jgi:RNA polymerase sigma-70 factor (ECF subfamily)
MILQDPQSSPPSSRETQVVASRAADELRLSELMRRSQQGDRIAYEALLAELVVRLRRFLSAVGHGGRFGDGAAIEDVVQETLLSLHAKRHTYDPALPFLPWLHGIARYKAIDYFRGRGAERRLVERLVDAALVDLDAIERPSSQQPRELQEDLATALSTLTKDQRKVIELAKIGEFSVAEVAQQTGLSQANVKVLTHRAMRALRRYFFRSANVDK